MIFSMRLFLPDLSCSPTSRAPLSRANRMATRPSNNPIRMEAIGSKYRLWNTCAKRIPRNAKEMPTRCGQYLPEKQ